MSSELNYEELIMREHLLRLLLAKVLAQGNIKEVPKYLRTGTIQAYSSRNVYCTPKRSFPPTTNSSSSGLGRTTSHAEATTSRPHTSITPFPNSDPRIKYRGWGGTNLPRYLGLGR